MARPRTATALLLKRNSFKKHPERLTERALEPRPTEGIGEAPAHLTKAQKRIWNEFIGIAPPGVLSNFDRPMLEITVCLMDQQRRRTIADCNLSKLITCLSKLGMNPASRAGLKADPSKQKKETDEFSEFIEENAAELLRNRSPVC